MLGGGSLLIDFDVLVKSFLLGDLRVGVRLFCMEKPLLGLLPSNEMFVERVLDLWDGEESVIEWRVSSFFVSLNSSNSVFLDLGLPCM